jgi:hypothetical protein
LLKILVKNMSTLFNELHANNFAILELADNPSPASAVRKDFVIQQISEVKDLLAALSAKITTSNTANIKSPCAVAITTPFNLVNGGFPIVQGVSITPNTRVLLTAQSNPAENGLYIARLGHWIRAFDSNDPTDFTFGFTVEVLGGDNRGYWMLATPDPIQLDVTPLNFQKQNGVTPGGGVIGISSGGTGGITPESARKNLGAAEEIVFSPLGDGKNSVFVIPHGLDNAKILEPSVIDLATQKYVQASSRILDSNNIEVAFGRPPAPESIAVTIVGVRR